MKLTRGWGWAVPAVAAIAGILFAASAFTADTTDPVLDIELAREVQTAEVAGTAANSLWGRLTLCYEPKRPPLIAGPAMLIGYWGGTVATTGFAQVQFAAIPSSELENLV